MSSRPPRLWRFRVRDILDAIERLQQYTVGMDFDTFHEDRRTLDAVERNFILIGEAAAHVPESIVRQFPDVPWRMMRDMRNAVVHMYWGIDVRQLWATIQSDLPALVPKLERVLEAGVE